MLRAYLEDRYPKNRIFDQPPIIGMVKYLCLMANTSISIARVARALDALVLIYGKPACIVSNTGTQFTSRALLKSAGDSEVDWDYFDSGKPQ